MTETKHTHAHAHAEGDFPGNLTTALLTMSSLEIAGLTGKAHAHVLRDADKMLGELDITASRFGSSYQSKQGKSLRCLNLPKRETLILVSGYSTEMRARIIDRWLQLEAAIGGQGPIDSVTLERIERSFGILRKTIHKVTEIEKLLPTIKQEAIEAALAADPRRAVLDYVSVRQLLVEAKAMQRGRDRINRKIGRELCDRIASTPGARRQCPHSGVWLYPRDFASLYMAQRGSALVREHNDRVTGQGVIKFPDRRKTESQERPRPDASV